MIIPDPYFVLYEYQLILLGAKPVYVDTYPDFSLKEDALRKALTNKTKAILINSPNNPTGVVYSRQELEMVARVAREKNLFILSDDIYDRFVFEEGLRNNYLGQLYENTLTIGGFSKTWAMTGWRLGFVAGPKEIIQIMITNQQYVFSSVNSVAQKAALFALDYNTDGLIAAYKKRRDLIYEGLRDKYEVVQPKGAYYIFPRVPGDDGMLLWRRRWKRTFLSYPVAYSQEENLMSVFLLLQARKTS